MISIARCTLRLFICCTSVGILAMRSAIVSTSRSSASAAKARLAKPTRTASLPLIASPVSIISIAGLRPHSQAWNWLSGGLIIRTGGEAILASSAPENRAQGGAGPGPPAPAPPGPPGVYGLGGGPDPETAPAPLPDPGPAPAHGCE